MNCLEWNTLLGVLWWTSSKNNLIFLSKKVRTQAVESLNCRYPLLGMSLMCSWFGFSRKAWYAAIKQMENSLFEFDLVIVEIKRICKRIPGIGSWKLCELIKPFFFFHQLKIGRNKLVLRQFWWKVFDKAILENKFIFKICQFRNEKETREFKHLRFYRSNTLSPKLTKKLIHWNMQMITIVVMAYVFSVQQGISQGVKKNKMYRDQSKSLAISFFR